MASRGRATVTWPAAAAMLRVVLGVLALASGWATGPGGSAAVAQGSGSGPRAPGRPAVAVAEAKGKPARTVATGFRIEGDGRSTHVVLEVSRPIAASIFTLGDPYRVVVDADDLVFQFPISIGRAGRGLVTGFRYGQFEAGRSRIVMDAAAPVLIEQARMMPGGAGQPNRLEFDLVRITPEQFEAQMRKAPPGAGPAMRRSVMEEGPAVGVPKAGRQRPVIVIDPGHGGIDPGTVSSTNVTEKSVVLAIALQLRALLTASRQLDVVMTRQDDAFVSLDQRLRISAQQHADLFVSLHADSLSVGERQLAPTIHGATVYVLSEKASDDTARLLAEKENSADVLAGLDAVPASDEDQVRTILIDLVRRETSNFSAQFRQLLVHHFRGKVPLSRDPQRSAAFKVLKQAETPSVLVEIGYMSNADDLARLSRPDWQRQVAAAVASAIDGFFAQRMAKAKP